MKIPEIEISIRFKNKPETLMKMKTSQDVAEIARTLFCADTIAWREEMILLCLNRQNELIGWYKVSSGGTASTVVDPKIVYTIALHACADSIILVHNHPSGNLIASQQDIDISKRIKSAGEILDIKLLDHIIIIPDSNNYTSLADEGSLV